ncbi:MAG: hypothetical protein ACRDYW_05900 [Acidimicrobiales bacterium]
MTVSSNGVHPNGSSPTAVAETDAGAASLAALRRRPDNVHLFRGYGPLVVGAILFVLMVVLAPTVAPERVVERPVGGTTTTTPTLTTEPAGTAETTVAP